MWLQSNFYCTGSPAPALIPPRPIRLPVRSSRSHRKNVMIKRLLTSPVPDERHGSVVDRIAFQLVGIAFEPDRERIKRRVLKSLTTPDSHWHNLDSSRSRPSI
ncbi:hypothetical protein EVAR_61779_1 [Eumeta japonica]|uniref:Uncharacterized protein n=1 Tax=Eumeta variegata TaxID=151549 RepID=A0A4C1YY21_EUMVA|nr:hypothetical protein EVAR_61779_1 [Eumeta japonica]